MPKPLFKTKQVNIQTLGDYLTQIRAQLNMDLKSVAMLTQIKPQYLELIEAGRWQDLPGDVYIRGFIKSLAQLYHVNEQILIDQYDKEFGFGQVKKPVAKDPGFVINFTPRTVIIIVTIVLALGAIGYVVSQVSSVLTPPMLSLDEPAQDLTVTDNTIIFSGRAEVGADVFINGQVVPTERTGEFNEALILSPGVNVVEVVVRNRFNRESRIVRNVNADIAIDQPIVENAAVTVTVEVGPNSAWLYLEADGVVVQRGTMLPGASKTVTATSEVLLTSADAGSTRVIYNNTDLGVLGRDGEVIRNVEFRAVETNN